MSTPPSPETTLPDRGRNAPSRWPAGVALAGLCGITLAFYHGLWLPGLVLIKRDAYRFFLPLKQYLIERLSAGELPQWFPYEGLGRPYIGVTHTGVFHPFTALYFFFSVPDAYRLSTLLSCLLAALGAFALGRTLNVSRAGALLAGLTFALSGYVVSLTDNLIYLYSICLLPIFCAGLEKARVGLRAWTVAPAVAWATVFLNGDVQTGYYYFFIALLWMSTRAPRSCREAGIRLALIAGLAVLLAGIQLGPAWAVFVDSERAQTALFQKEVLSRSTHPLRLGTILASAVGDNTDPVILGRISFDSPMSGMWAESIYLGVPVVGLALLGAWHRRDLHVLTWLGGLALLLALGRYGGLYEIFYRVVPFWSAFRYPEKFIGIVSFAMAMLAGMGLDLLRTGKGCPALWLVVAALCASLWLGLRSEAASAWVAASYGAPGPLAHEMTSSAAVAFLSSTAAALGVWIAVFGAHRGWLRLEVLPLILAVIVTVDLSRTNLGTYHTAPVVTATFMPPLAEALHTREGTLAPGRFRIISTDWSNTVVPEHILKWLGYYGAASIERRQAIDAEHNAQFHIETANRYLTAASASLASLLWQKPGIEVVARYNVTYYIGRRFHFQNPRFARSFVAELPDYDLALFRNPVLAKPRAYLSQRPERTAAPVDPAALIARPDFLDGQVDVIEAPAANLPGPAPDGAAVIERYGPEAVRVRVETPQPGVLILLDAFEKGWTATLENGLELPILRANALVRAVIVPAGTHVVTFWYETPLLYTGAVASSAGVLLCLGLIVQALWRTRQTGSTP